VVRTRLTPPDSPAVPLHPSLPRQPRAHLLQVPDSVAHRGSGHTLSSRMQCKGAATAHRWSRQASNRGCARAQVSPGGAPERAVGDDGGGWHPCGGPSGPPGRGRAGGADALVRRPRLRQFWLSHACGKLRRPERPSRCTDMFFSSRICHVCRAVSGKPCRCVMGLAQHFW